MKNNYEASEILEIGKAKNLVLGTKISDPEAFDVRTQQLGSMIIDQLGDDE